MSKLLSTKIDPIVNQGIDLRASQFEALTRLAAALDIRASKGTHVGQPSWRTMMARLAEWDAPKDEMTPLDEFITEYFGLKDVIK